MANGITSGLESLLGIDTTAGNAQMQQALQALQAVGVPTTQQLTLPELQKYVSAGVLSPEQYQAISANPEAYQQAVQANLDTSGTNAQKSALQQLSGISQAGGSTAINQANLKNNIDQTNQAMQAARSGIMEQAQQQGAANGGLNFINQFMNEQSNANTANTGAVNAASNNAQLALNALANQGTVGGQLQSQSNQMATNAGQAAQQVAQYNSQLQSAANQYNTQNANQAQQMNLSNAQNLSNQNVQGANQRAQYNAQVPQTEFSDQMQKAGAIANNYGQQASLAEQQAQGQNSFTGNLLGTAGTIIGGMYGGPAGAAIGGALGKQVGGNTGGQYQGSYNQYANQTGANPNQYAPYNNNNGQGFAQGGEVQGMCNGGKCYAQGGEVHDHEICMKVGGMVPGTPKVPGDSPKNDTVPARLSPHEIVLPRTVAQAPNAPQQAAQFVNAIKSGGKMPGNPTTPQIPGATPNVNSFAEALKLLEANGLELRLAHKGV